MCKHTAKKFCKEWTKKRKFIKKMRLRKMSNIMNLRYPNLNCTAIATLVQQKRVADIK